MTIGVNEAVLIFGLILTVLNIIDRAHMMKARANAPRRELESRINRLESDVTEIRTLLSNDNNRILTLEEGNKVLIKSMNALLSQEIDGNSIEEMRKAREELNNYLISRK